MNKKIFYLSLYFFYINISSLFSEELPVTSLNCKNKNSTELLKAGFELQKDNNSLEALSIYLKSLALDPDCVDTLYEIGWSYWKIGDWDELIKNWEKALTINPSHEKIIQFLPAAKANALSIHLNPKNKNNALRKETELFLDSNPKDGPMELFFVSRYQSYNKKPKHPMDHYDLAVNSPKSAIFSKDGKKVYVQSLEGGETIVFSSDGLKKIKTISHAFKNDLFIDKDPPFDYKFINKNPTQFTGKPVESVLTHGGKFLWVTYYRRSFDDLGQEPSALAIIDTETDEIKRVIGTGSISKYVEASPDGKWIVVSNWGDNTIGVYDIQGDDVSKFHPVELLTVEKRMSLKNIKSVNRDKNCGYCVRGLTFSKDSRYLFVTRMKGGGIAVFDFNDLTKKIIYLGTIFGLQPGPRDIHLSPNGEYLYIGCNSSGTIVKVSVENMIEKLKNNNGKSQTVTLEQMKAQKEFVGLGIRSFKLSQDGKYIFVAVNNSSEIVVMNAEKLKVLSRMPVDSYPVGLALGQNNDFLWVTSQGKDALGGNSISVFQLHEKIQNEIHMKEDKIVIEN